MNSKERHEARYQRRKQKRLDKKNKFLNSLGSFEDVFNFNNLYDAFNECKKGVLWKASIQSYQACLPLETAKIYSQLMDGSWKSRGFTEFDIFERGKTRHIQSVHISERCIQRAFCDHYLVPALERNLIYDNGASIKGKGTDFTLNRLKHHLRDFYIKNKSNDGYILLYDFSNFFGNIDHKILFKQNADKFADKRLCNLYIQLISAFDKGLGLGSQVSQISAVAFPNKIDHYFKDYSGIKYYGRYMDDGYIISNDLEKLKSYQKNLVLLCNELGISINDKKIKICKINNGFVFLKKKIKITDTGKIIMKLSNKSISQERRKLKRLASNPNVTYKDIRLGYGSWRGNAIRYNNFKAIRNMDKLYDDLFIAPFVTRKSEHICPLL